MELPSAAMLVIGDEILSGRTRDANMHHLAQALTAHGIALKEVRIVNDDHAAIVQAVRALSVRADHVFTSGGIGPTHDDITAEAVAAAFDTPITIRDDARAILQAHYDRQNQTLNEARLRMARIPDGAQLIDNPISAAPGFTLGNVHVMAGVPVIFETMVKSVLASLNGGPVLISGSVRVDRGEGDIAAHLTEIAEAHPEVQIGSYPFQRDGRFGANIVVRHIDATLVETVLTRLRTTFPDAT
ncbi:MAG: molybdopterin-binding protein [Pseudomonadota bacterium]